MVSWSPSFTMLMMLPLIAFAAPVPLQKDMPYITARTALLKAGWRPVNMHPHNKDALLGVEHELYSAKFKEFESCSIDYSNCVMRYKRLGQCLAIYTIGEKIQDMKVTEWNSECPPPAPRPSLDRPEK